MAANKIIRIPPVAIPTTTANFASPPALSGGVPADTSSAYLILRHIRVVNKSATTAALFGLYQGATTGNATDTQVIAAAVATAPGTPASTYSSAGISVAANSFFEWFGLLRLQSGDFLTMLGNTATTATAGLVIQAEGEIGII